MKKLFFILFSLITISCFSQSNTYHGTNSGIGDAGNHNSFYGGNSGWGNTGTYVTAIGFGAGYSNTKSNVIYIGGVDSTKGLYVNLNTGVARVNGSVLGATGSVGATGATGATGSQSYLTDSLNINSTTTLGLKAVYVDTTTSVVVDTLKLKASPTVGTTYYIIHTGAGTTYLKALGSKKILDSTFMYGEAITTHKRIYFSTTGYWVVL
jgi:hypothetical protein